MGLINQYTTCEEFREDYLCDVIFTVFSHMHWYLKSTETNFSRVNLSKISNIAIGIGQNKSL